MMILTKQNKRTFSPRKELFPFGGAGGCARKGGRVVVVGERGGGVTFKTSRAWTRRSNHWYNVLLSPCHCWLVFTNELTEIEEPSNLATQGGLCAGAWLSPRFLMEWRVLSSHVAAQFTSPQSCWCHWHRGGGPEPPKSPGGGWWPSGRRGSARWKCCPRDSGSNPTARARLLKRPVHSAWVMISLALDLMSDLITRV